MFENLIQQLTVHLGGAPLVALAVAFAGGLIVSLTPCVYPVLPLTVAFIGAGSAGATRMRGFVLSLIYVSGLALTYAVLGVVSALFNKVFGSLATSPGVLICVGVFFFIFGLAMMDVIPLPLPQALTNIQPRKRGGAAGVFLVGVISGLIAMPCSTPVLLAILTHIAQRGGVVYGFALMFSYALGFGVLLVVVGTSAGAITALPSSGAWMNWTKRIAGIIIIAFGVYYLYNGVAGLSGSPAEPVSDASFIAVNDAQFMNEQIGKGPVLFVFFGSWCKVCAEEVPELNKIYNEFNDKGLAFYGVDITDNREKALEFIEKHDVQYPVIWDATQKKVAGQFKILSTPTIIIYDAWGEPVYVGADPPHAMRGHIADALGDKEPELLESNVGERQAPPDRALLEITIIGDSAEPGFDALARAAGEFEDPNKEIVLYDTVADAALIAETPYAPMETPAMFACLVDVACARPITDPDKVDASLRRFIAKFSGEKPGALDQPGDSGQLAPLQ